VGTARRSSRCRRGINHASPMGLELKSRRLVTLNTGGRGGQKELLNAFSSADVESMKLKRLGRGAAVTVTLRGVRVKLESRQAPRVPSRSSSSASRSSAARAGVIRCTLHRTHNPPAPTAMARPGLAFSSNDRSDGTLRLAVLARRTPPGAGRARRFI
jgi:hypothetical protein